MPMTTLSLWHPLKLIFLFGAWWATAMQAQYVLPPIFFSYLATGKIAVYWSHCCMLPTILFGRRKDDEKET